MWKVIACKKIKQKKSNKSKRIKKKKMSFLPKFFKKSTKNKIKRE
jgi:hypothetical protein